jgi:hypothetical protein
MADMTDDWIRFSEEVKDHIAESGKKYKLAEGVELANLLPWSWALGDATKYLIEVCRWISEGVIEKYTHPREIMMKNLIKAAHCIQITYSKLEAMKDEKKEWA